MATSFTQSLFGGVDPYKVQRENIQQLFAPITQAQDPYSKIGASLGVLGGMALFGMPQDPRLAKVTEIQQTVKDVMGEAPDEATFAERLPMLEQAFSDKGLIEQAAIIAKTRKDLTPDTVFAKINPSQYTKESIEEFKKKNDYGVLVPVKTPQQIGISTTGKKVYVQNDIEYTLENGKRVPFSGTLRYSVPESPTVKAFDKLQELRKGYLFEVKNQFEGYSALQNAKTALSQLTGVGDEVAKRMLLKASGESGSGLSTKDVQAFSNFGPLGQRIAGAINKLLEGTYSDDQRKEIVSLMDQLQVQLENQVSATRNQYRAVGQDLKKGDLDFIAPSLSSIYSTGSMSVTSPAVPKPSPQSPSKSVLTLPSGNKARLLP